MYDDFKANIYAGYRPELHDVPLSHYFGERVFGRGVDVGCGVGHSARALLNHCWEVTALDNSRAMLAKAKPEPRIRYRRWSGGRWPVADKSVDVITFAGSLFYLDGGAALQEIRRVGKPGSHVVVYDYRFDPRPFLSALGVGPFEPPVNAYRWDCQLPVDETGTVSKLQDLKSEVLLIMEAQQLAYTILAEDWCRTLLSAKFGSENPAEELTARLAGRYAVGDRIPVDFKLISFHYRLHPGAAD
ncbi:methyltransferase family protein [Neolewinella xylanilytica]|uniref:Methyltransferase family protein n=1 Tax=Neolewinella xylanilytica TaxID=1514080 RepID=A0A2S6I3V2_9BACT|nr:class I SAM-dependent methyltransferase [Neolewinella xylanilytica]PPK85856.1 methyltransferase family protein [Neolewinella xylanilytica]